MQTCYFFNDLLLASIFLKKIVGAPISREGGHVLSGPFLGQPIASFIYILHACVRPAATLLSLRTGSVSQSVFNSRRDQSTPVVAEFGRSLAAGRYVAVANKVLIL